MTINPLKIQSIFPALLSSAMMSVAGMADALLYAYLPVEGVSMGLSTLSIGIILSVNKFVRFFFNRWIAVMATKFGLRILLIGGMILAGLTTWIYSTNPASWIWILSRAGWGLAYSSLRFATTQYSGLSARMGSALGIGKSIQELGPIVAYLIGPIFIRTVGMAHTMMLFSFLTWTLFPLLKVFPDFRFMNQAVQTVGLRWPSWIDGWVFVSSFLLEGVLIVGISKLVIRADLDTVDLVTVSGIYISLRRMILLGGAPLAGWLCDHGDFKRLFRWNGCLVVLGLGLILFQYPGIGLILTFLGTSLAIILMPILAMVAVPSSCNFEMLTRINSYRDLGGALGCLLGLFILSSLGVSVTLVIFGSFLLVGWIGVEKQITNGSIN